MGQHAPHTSTLNNMDVHSLRVYLDLRKINQDQIMTWCNNSIGPVNQNWQYWKLGGGLLVIEFNNISDLTQFQLAWSNA
jgi:hypothetical protein